MAFRNQILALSELVADIITGAIFQTDSSGPRIEIRSIAGVPRIKFYVNDDTVHYSPGDMIASVSTVPGSEVGLLYIDGVGSIGFQQTPAIILQSATTIAGTLVDLFTGCGQVLIKRLTIGNNGSQISQFVRGTTGAVNTNAAGKIVVNHGLGVNPNTILWSDNDASAPHHGYHVPSADTNANFTIQFRNTTTGAATAGGVGVSGEWIALA